MNQCGYNIYIRYIMYKELIVCHILNASKPYLRLAESRYVKDIGRQKKFVLKNLGPLSKFDDGKPDFLKRFREKFKNGEIDFD